MEQLVARQAHNLKVSGSSPLPATISKPWMFSSEAFFVPFPMRKWDSIFPQSKKLQKRMELRCRLALADYIENDSVFETF